MPSASMSSAVTATKRIRSFQSHSTQRWWPETRMFMTSANSSMETKARCSLVWFGRAVSGRPLVSLTTRPVAGPKRTSTTLFKEKGTVTTMLSTTSPVRKKATRYRSCGAWSGSLAPPGFMAGLQTLEQPRGRETDRPGVENDVVVRGDQHAHHDEQHARPPLHHVDERPVAFEEAQEDAETGREDEEGHAEPSRVGQEQSHAPVDGLLVARQCEDGAQDGADAGCPTDREGQPHREGAEKPGGLAADLELDRATEWAPLEHARD